MESASAPAGSEPELDELLELLELDGELELDELVSDVDELDALVDDVLDELCVDVAEPELTVTGASVAQEVRTRAVAAAATQIRVRMFTG